MKKQTKIALVELACLVLTVSSVHAEAGVVDSVKGGAFLYNVDIEGYDTMSGVGLVVGAAKVIQENISVSAEAMVTLIKSTMKVSRGDLDYSASSLAVYGVYTLPINKEMEVCGKAGLARVSVDASIGSYSDSDSSIGLTFGFGGSFVMEQNLTISAEYLYLASVENGDGTISGIGVNATHKF